jgi:multicomponent K+:H+ antiporter subunit E
MRLLLPYPIASGCFLAFWVMLNQSLSLGHLILGTGAGLVGGWALAALEQPTASPRRLVKMVRLAGRVFADIVRSNIAVTRIVLGFERRGRKSGFVDIPLELRDPYGLATLACIITSTPGTLWVSFDAANGVLTIHVLDLVDRAEWVRTIKERYERPLLEIFE